MYRKGNFRKELCFVILAFFSVVSFGCLEGASEKSTAHNESPKTPRSPSESDGTNKSSCDGDGRNLRGFSLQGDPEQEVEVHNTAYGPISDKDIDALYAFAKEYGYDLKGDLQQVYEGNSKEALGRVFQFSLAFKTLDKNAMSYGAIIFNSLLNLGEVWTINVYADILNGQSTEVVQRIRDFIFYPMETATDDEGRVAKEYSRDRYPMLFPRKYEFGENDSLFKNSISPPP
jgi:hypothetical protein